VAALQCRRFVMLSGAVGRPVRLQGSPHDG
jgi:hypothetical protein